MNWPADFIDKVICGDCLGVLQDLPDGSIDLCIADPPFNVGLKYDFKFNDLMPEDEYWNWLETRLIEIFRILKEGSRFYIFHKDKGIFKLNPICEKIGFNFRQLLIWYGPNMPGRSIKGDWHYMHENILLFGKGKPGKLSMINAGEIANCFSVQIHTRPQSNFKGGRDHPAQKPISLYSALIARTPGDIFLDPFCGVASSLIAAKNLNRSFIGIEINPDYCKIAEERLTQGVL